MKVILTEDMRGIGKKGEIKEVKPGYGQNFLIKNHHAVLASDDNLKALKRENNKKATEDLAYQKECLKMKEALEKQDLVFHVKTGAQDKVFGSVSVKQIASELNKLGYKIDKHKIQLNQPITTLGTTIVDVKMHKNVTIHLNVKLQK